MATKETVSEQRIQQSQPNLAKKWLTLRNICILLVVFGIGVSGYLSYVTLVNTEMICAEGAVFNCDAVRTSDYAKMAGIPIAVLGLGTYLVMGGLVLLENRIEVLRRFGVEILFGITLFAWLYSMWLVYLQVFRIQALCMWCLLHELNITGLFVVVSVLLWKKLSAPLPEED